MEKISLRNFVLKIGQARAARALSAKPSSIAKAIRTGRAIIVTVNDDGSCSGEETRPFPSKIPTHPDCGKDSELKPCEVLEQATEHPLA